MFHTVSLWYDILHSKAVADPRESESVQGSLESRDGSVECCLIIISIRYLTVTPINEYSPDGFQLK